MARIVFVIEILFFCLGLSVSFLQGGNFSKILEAKKKLLKNGSNTNESSSGNLSRNTLTEGDIDFKNPVVVRENLPTVFTSQHARENTEKIQLLNHDRVIKSTFVPIVSEGMTVRRHNKSKSFNTNNNQINPKKILAYHENLKIKVNDSWPLIKNFSGFGNKSLLKRHPKRPKELKKEMHAVGKMEGKKIERSFELFPAWLSLNPIHWMTKTSKIEMADAEQKEETQNLKSWFKLDFTPVQSNVKANKSKPYSSEKIKKLLNLFTVLKFDESQCIANGLNGICLHQATCKKNGGKFASTCARENGVCCYTEKTCGDHSKENSTYFVNEGFPKPYTVAPKVCTLTLDKVSPEVKQLRLEFLNFKLRDPLNGTCLHDRLIITGQDVNKVIPEICGENNGQHVYIDIDESEGPYKLNVITIGEYFPRNFRIKITQLKTGDELLAPKNCLQYFIEPSGLVQTFNYKSNLSANGNESDSGYFNNLNYAICIKKIKGFCSISYENNETDSTQPTFQIVNVNKEGEQLLAPRQAGAETFDCPDDYLIVSGMRLCGEKLNDGSLNVDFTKNYPVTDTSNGPFTLYIRTDSSETGRGFLLRYKQNPCII